MFPNDGFPSREFATWNRVADDHLKSSNHDFG